ncbi:MAG: GFA family protein [Polyangiaceae bacterium]|jgi:hypothetical protein
MATTYEGGCHCGAVRFRVEVEQHVALDCNCTICRMKGILHLIVSREQFTLLKGEDALTTYRFNTGVARHMFCRFCGIHPFYIPRSHPNGMDVNVRCLDDQEAMSRFQVEKFDGKQWDENVEKIR